MRLRPHAFPATRLPVAAALLALAGTARAEAPGDRFWGQLEGYRPSVSSTARLDVTATSRPGSEVRLEDELGLTDRKTLPYLLLGMRFAENWRLEFEYYQLNRSGTRAIQRDISWGDVTFPASAEISSVFDTSIYRLSAGYSFYRTGKAEAGAALGLHTTDFRIGLSGQGIGPQGGTASFQREERDQLVPLPTLGLYGTYLLNDQWMLRGRVDYLSFEYNQYDGSLINWMGAVDWRFHKNFGVGLAYRYVDYELEATKTNFHGSVNYRFSGPSLYMEAAF